MVLPTEDNEDPRPGPRTFEITGGLQSREFSPYMHRPCYDPWTGH